MLPSTTRLAWTTSLALCAALFATGCDNRAGDDAGMDTLDPGAPTTTGDHYDATTDRPGTLSGTTDATIAPPTGYDPYDPAPAGTDPAPAGTDPADPVPAPPAGTDPLDDPSAGLPQDDPATSVPVEPDPADPGIEQENEDQDS